MHLWNSKLSWSLLIIAIVGDFIVAYLLALFYPKYSHMKQVMSVLGNPESSVALFYNIWLVVLGILLIISAFNFYHVFSPVSKSWALIGCVLLMVFAIGAGVLSGIFSVNENKEEESMAAKIHGIGAGLGFIALAFIPLIVSLLLFKSDDYKTAALSLFFFLLSLVFFVFFVISEKEVYKDSILGLSGLWQRLFLASMYMPLLLIALKLILENTGKINP